MQCDVRQLHPDDLAPLWAKVKKYLSQSDITNDDGEWFMKMTASSWRFDSHGRGFEFNADGTVNVDRACIFISYHPPRGGNVRFDAAVYTRRLSSGDRIVNRAILQEYGEALAKYGHGGKNRLSHFEQLADPDEVQPTRMERWLNWLRRWL